MTSFSKAVIVDSQVFTPGAPGRSGMALEGTVEYLMREGKFESRGGLECEPTEMDLKLMAEGGRTASLSDIADYGARQGKFEGRNPEIPMAPGEFSGGAWDARGIVDVEAMKREIAESGSNVMRSVITVPREWAPQLGLVTKQQWQELVRGCWDDSMADWRVMPREDQRWCAFFHTDNKVNLHVHILSWDASGCHFAGEKRVPRENFFRSVETVKRAAYQKYSTERSIEKGYVRQALVLQAKLEHGATVREAEIRAVEDLRPEGCAAAIARDERLEGAARERMDSLRERLVDALPPEGVGRASYKGVSQEARAAANLMVLELRKAPAFARLYNRYVELAERGADILGRSGRAREDYVRDQTRDVDRRLANIFIRDAARDNQPWTRSPELARARAEVVAKAAADGRSASIFAKGIVANRPIAAKAVIAAGHRAIESQGLERAASEYAGKVAEWARERSDREIPPEQAARLESRALADLAGQIGAKSLDAGYQKAVAVLVRSDGALMSEVVREAAYGRGEGYELVYMTPAQREELSGAIAHAARECARRGLPDREFVAGIASRIMGLPDVQSALAIEAEARVRSERAHGTPARFEVVKEQVRASRTAFLEDRVEREVMRLAAHPVGERSMVASGVLGALAAAALRTAASGRAVERGGSREGMVRTRAKKHQHQQELSR